MTNNKLAAYAKRLWLVDPDRFAPYLTRVLSYAKCYTRAELDAQLAELETKAQGLFAERALEAGGLTSQEEHLEAPKAIRAVKGKVGVIPIHGPVDQHWSSELAKSGGTSIDFIARALDIGLANPGIGAIVLHMDCPGGTSYGVQELSDKIYKARAEKPIYAMIDSMACSAGLWIGSAATMMICTPGGDTGSHGVYRMHVDESAALEEEGVKITFVHAGKYKVEYAPTMPLSEDAKARMQERVDATYDKFTAALKRNRNTTADHVKKNYGQGRVLSADEALAVGMIDRIMAFEDLLAKLTGDGAANVSAGAAAGTDAVKERLRRIEADRRHRRERTASL
jgi:signal peptide peptidase SppA